MKRTVPVVCVMLAAAAVLWRCGGVSGDECSPDCEPGFVCYFGSCVPDQDATADAEVGADADVAADGDADGDTTGDAEVTPDILPEGETAPDVPPDVVPDVPPDVVPDVPPDVVPDVPPDGETVVDIVVDGEVVDVRPDGETVVDIVVDGEVVDVRPDTDVADITPDTTVRCGPWPGGGCGEGQVCDIRSCFDGASGICVPRPVICTPIWAPVCGCDGVTYGNDCERLAVGMALDHEGECAAPAAPECVRGSDGGTAWMEPDGSYICHATCTGCTASCLYEGSFSEGWYAICASGTDGGCGLGGGLIVWDDCSP